ncbi:MAG: tRNA adenosine(34) deaminase TadA [Hyphomonadaceae bacterium]|nr:tRNA adenosine(34) deaminase TadA [Hyphomonadaceae bacterium]
MSETFDLEMMQRALVLARAAAAAGEAPIGAVVANEATGEVVAEAHNRPIGLHDPTGHAEILALRAAAEKLSNYRLPGLTLYVTLEPCAMCAGAISHARVSRLVFGAADEKGGAVANGVQFFDQPTCHSRPLVSSGVLENEASALLKEFFRARR